MAKKLQLQGHLAPAELERRYRAARDAVERSHYQIIWLLSEGKTTTEVIAATGYSRGWIQQLVQRYNADGPAGLGDRRHRNPGGQALLDEVGQAELRAALAADAPDGGLWNGPKVAQWIARKLGRPVGKRRGYVYLRRLGQTPKVPRPTHAAADPQEQQQFPKG